MVGCCAVGCTNSTGKGFIMKRFPSDPQRRKAWVEKVNRENWTPTDASRLCVAHFALDIFEHNRADGKLMLRRNAIPTIFSRIPQRNCRKSLIDKRFSKRCELKEEQSVPAVNKVSENSDHVKDPIATYCDEEENYDISRSTAIKIKVEPGLTDDMYQDDASKDYTEDFFAGYSRLKEETNTDSMNQEEHLVSMVDVENATYIKQEDKNYFSSQPLDVKIKVEPGLSEDDASHDYIT